MVVSKSTTGCICNYIKGIGCSTSKCECCRWCCDKCNTSGPRKCETCGKSTGTDDNTDGKKCTNLLKCRCKTCTPRSGIVIFFGIIMVLLVIGIIMYFLAWTSIPDFETFRNYWKNGMPSTHFKK
ncbi:hypothetical protein BBBOND_0211740 [Babesia bigemina]|uniref:Uncharacterized protein n=1 Tax=Babesia bigemina TaxID=5866 RepID=A0A061D7R4_BABBI|nr:hypothetical protein BBBOND_0211740 [Babesia bigemina]CDR96032.1 hypothetical protein BBBOND_0211740 [Babesia bigemina]|eukprot:XP_012768218.1 hypothetical protein BBBOND_0211740 [Babesia bigemina]